MKKNMILVLLLLLVACSVFALPITKADASRVARNLVTERLGSNYSVAETIALDSGYPTTYIYAINLKPSGFVLISADNAATPIIGYSTDNNWNEYEIPVQLQYMLGIWNSQMHAIVTGKMIADANIRSAWDNYNKDIHSFTPNTNFRNVSPLLSSIWGQGTYYNTQCPSGTPVGCVATAMVQIMRYWSFPSVGSGTHSYTCSPYGTLSADFGATAYNWASMPSNVTSSNTAVATVCYQAGVAVEMDYAPDGSGAYSTDVPNALQTYFKYASSTQYAAKSSYSDTNWLALIKGQLDSAHPVYYSGSGTAGGHAWVVDGYLNDTFHINWGWNGSYNGYFALSSLNPGGESFNSGQAAVIGIVPTSTNPTLSEGFEGTTFPPTGWSVTASTFARSATNYITGAYSARYNVTANGATASGKQLKTPALTIDATCPNLTFKARAGTTLRAEQIKVGYGASASGPWTYFSTNAVLATTAASFSYVVNTLTPGSYYFVFETYSTNGTSNSKTWIIDDVAGPYRPIPTQASLNMTSWAAGALSPGDEARSGNIFTLANVGTGNLTVTSVTNLSGTDFSTNFNSAINLVYGQTHDFSFTYDPLDYGTDNVSFQIVTTGGTVTIALSGSATSSVFYDGFENYTDFSLTMSPWTQYDVDLLPTYTVTGYSWLNAGYTGAWMDFNPSTSTPAMNGTYPAYNGSKVASCWAAVPGTATANNDWLVTPALTLSSAGTVSFWAKNFSSTYNPETLVVKYSTTTNAMDSFTTTLATISLTTTTWTNYSYAIPQGCKYIALVCTSVDMFSLWVDEFKVTDNTVPPAPAFGNLSGHVYASGTTNPIANALVTVGTKVCYTDAYGFYQITNLLVGSVSASCTAPGMFYHFASASGIAITNGETTTHDFGLTWGEIAASPTSVSASLYQGETGSASVVLTNPGGTADTAYAGYFTGSARGTDTHTAPFISDPRKPSADVNGVRIPKITNTSSPDRSPSWFSYAAIADANYFSGVQTERGNYFVMGDFALMDGATTISQLRGYFYNPSTAAWTTTTHRTFAWKIYSVSSTGTVSLLHTSSNIVLPTTTADTYTLNEYTLPSSVTIPAGYDFIVTAKPSSATDTSGRPQSLATDNTSDNGMSYSSTGGWASAGLDYLVDAYVDGTRWMTSYNFSGNIAPNGSVSMPLEFNTTGVSAGTKNAYMYVYNDANYVAPSPVTRGDALVIPISLNVTVATTPVAVITTGTNWKTVATVGAPTTTGDVFTLKNVGPGNLTITSISGLSGTPFTTNFNTGTILAQNSTYSFGFTFTPTVTGIWDATFTIVTNGGTKTITLKGYGNYIAESFDGATFPPDGWTAQDVDGDTNSWMQYTATGAALTGLNCAASASYVNDAKSAQQSHSSSSRGALTPNNWLITPRLAITTGDELSYWIAAQDAAWPAEYYSVKLSTTDSQIASFTNTLFSETLTDGEWQNHVISLNAYAGQSVYIAFQHYNCTDQFVLKLDDVLMPPFAAPLVYGSISGRVTNAVTAAPLAGVTVSVAGRTAVTLEDGAYSITNIVSDTYQLTATATGYIAYSASVIIPENSNLTKDVTMNFAEVYTANTTFSRTLEQGTSATITVPMTNTGNATLEFETASGVWGGTIFPTTALNETFEDGDITGWVGSVGANSDIYGSTTTPYGYLSDKTWVFNSYETTAVQYLISPKLRVVTGDNLAFWYKQFNLSSETFEVRISTTDTDIASFTTTLATIGPLADQLWTNYSASLNAYAGSDIYVCFYYPRVDSYQYGYVMIDNVTGPIMVAAPTDWLSCTPVGYPVNETLAAAANTNLSLAVDATTLPVGTYTAQTWIFSNGLVSPYKLYVTLTVTEPVALDPAVPANLITEKTAGIFTIAWDESQDASSYIVSGCDTPYGTFVPIRTVADNYIELTDAELATAGLDAKAFFNVKASTETIAPPAKTGLTVQRKTSSHLHRNFINPVGSNQSKVMHKL